VPDEIELDDVATTRRDDRVDTHSCDVRPERRAELQPRLGIRRVDDRAPRAGAEQQLDDMAGNRVAEELPLHRREVVEENADRVEEMAHEARMP